MSIIDKKYKIDRYNKNFKRKDLKDISDRRLEKIKNIKVRSFDGDKSVIFNPGKAQAFIVNEDESVIYVIGAFVRRTDWNIPENIPNIIEGRETYEERSSIDLLFFEDSYLYFGREDFYKDKGIKSPKNLVMYKFENKYLIDDETEEILKNIYTAANAELNIFGFVKKYTGDASKDSCNDFNFNLSLDFKKVDKLSQERINSINEMKIRELLPEYEKEYGIDEVGKDCNDNYYPEFIVNEGEGIVYIPGAFTYPEKINFTDEGVEFYDEEKDIDLLIIGDAFFYIGNSEYYKNIDIKCPGNFIFYKSRFDQRAKEELKTKEDLVHDRVYEGNEKLKIDNEYVLSIIAEIEKVIKKEEKKKGKKSTEDYDMHFELVNRISDKRKQDIENMHIKTLAPGFSEEIDLNKKRFYITNKDESIIYIYRAFDYRISRDRWYKSMEHFDEIEQSDIQTRASKSLSVIVLDDEYYYVGYANCYYKNRYNIPKNIILEDDEREVLNNEDFYRYVIDDKVVETKFSGTIPKEIYINKNYEFFSFKSFLENNYIHKNRYYCLLINLIKQKDKYVCESIGTSLPKIYKFNEEIIK